MRTSFTRALAVWLAVPFLLALPVRIYAAATTINYTPAPTTFVGYNPCGSFPGYGCATSAYFDAGSLIAQNGDEVSSLFQQAWDTWNAANGNDWTLEPTVDDTLGGTFDINPAAAGQFGGVTLGGLTINIALNGVTLPVLGPDEQLVWVQGLYINYAPGPNAPTVTPYYAMDTSTLSNLTCGGNIFCPPAYPYQYNDNSFYDQPKAFYQPPGQTQAFFDANAYFAVENYDEDTIQLYDGVSYGFQNYVSPEPGTYLLFGTGLLGLFVLAQRKRAESV